MTSREEFDHLTGAYALNAVDNDERNRFEAHLGTTHLEGAGEARNEVAGLAETAALLGLAVEPVQPSAALKSEIMARIASTPQLPKESRPVVPINSDATAESVAESPAAEKARTRWFLQPATGLVAAASAAVMLVGGGVAANTIADLTERAEQAEQLAAINASDDLERAVVPVEGGGTATLVWSVELTSSALIMEGLDPLPSDRVYELWYMGDAGTRPAGLFTVDEDGQVWRVLEGDMGAGDVVGVTVEPRGGSDLPTTDPIITIESA